MSRETDLAKACFPVGLRDVLQATESGQMLHIPKYKAVANLADNAVFSVVTDNYRLVTNSEAVELGKICFKQLFDTVNLDDMEIFNIIMPKTKSFCHIDIIHKKHVVNIWKEEVWVPYLRITNSYNKMKALRFDLGFCRKLCDNGMIFEKEAVKFKFYHTMDHIAPEGEFHIDMHRLKELEKAFVECMHNLKRYYVPEEYLFPLVCKVLELSFNLDSENEQESAREREKFGSVKEAISKLRGQYYGALGPNGYSALNIISDFASRPFAYTKMNNMIDVYQKRTGGWIDSFLEAIASDDFKFEVYLADYMAFAA
ncbi:MAG: DUF932 domain-containing protein [Acidobacteria bacterium]|nr:DUF932 domain-containing protein [Acidobacteriota bacterium]